MIIYAVVIFGTAPLLMAFTYSFNKFAIIFPFIGFPPTIFLGHSLNILCFNLLKTEEYSGLRFLIEVEFKYCKSLSSSTGRTSVMHSRLLKRVIIVLRTSLFISSYFPRADYAFQINIGLHCLLSNFLNILLQLFLFYFHQLIPKKNPSESIKIWV
jgi:hypothetical protein